MSHPQPIAVTDLITVIFYRMIRVIVIGRKQLPVSVIVFFGILGRKM